jgi:NADP-dependent 3-hydroxy acid dehydrogenase YdfG
VRGVSVATGASSGIGAATEQRSAEAGFEIVVGARVADRLDARRAFVPLGRRPEAPQGKNWQNHEEVP